MAQTRRRGEWSNDKADQRQRAQDRKRRTERQWSRDRGLRGPRRRRSAPESTAAAPARPATARHDAGSRPNAAPIMPVKVSAGVPASSVNATADVDAASRFNNSPSTGVAMINGKPAAIQCARALAAHVSSSGVRLIAIRSSEPSSWSAMNNRSSGQQTCQQRAEPEDRRAESGQQRQIRSERERHQHHDGEKEQHPDQRSAADAQSDADVPSDQRSKRGHARPCRLILLPLCGGGLGRGGSHESPCLRFLTPRSA